MTQQEYLDKIEELDTYYMRAKQDIIKSYALSNNPYKVGDSFTDRTGTIRIEKILIRHPDIFNNIPSCVYEGVELKKNGEPKKGNPTRLAWQSNEVK